MILLRTDMLQPTLEICGFVLRLQFIFLFFLLFTNICHINYANHFAGWCKMSTIFFRSQYVNFFLSDSMPCWRLHIGCRTGWPSSSCHGNHIPSLPGLRCLNHWWYRWVEGPGGGGYSLYVGWYGCASVLTPFFDIFGIEIDLFGVLFVIHQHQNDLLGY